MAAHGGEDKGICAALLYKVNNGADNDGNVGDAAAAAGDGDGHAGTDLLADVFPLQLGVNHRGEFLRLKVGRVKLLVNTHHLGKGDTLTELFHNTVRIAFKGHDKAPF